MIGAFKDLARVLAQAGNLNLPGGTRVGSGSGLGSMRYTGPVNNTGTFNYRPGTYNLSLIHISEPTRPY